MGTVRIRSFIKAFVVSAAILTYRRHMRRAEPRLGWTTSLLRTRIRVGFSCRPAFGAADFQSGDS